MFDPRYVFKTTMALAQEIMQIFGHIYIYIYIYIYI